MQKTPKLEVSTEFLASVQTRPMTKDEADEMVSSMERYHQLCKEGIRSIGSLSPKRKLETDREVAIREDKIWNEAVQWAVEAWRAVFVALTSRDSSGHSITDKPALQFVRRYAHRYLRGTAIPILKFHTAYVFAKQQKQEELPEVPPCGLEGDIPGILGGGWVYKFCTLLMCASNRKLHDVAQDLLFAKKGMPVVPEYLVAQTMEKHYKAMSKPRLSGETLPKPIKLVGKDITTGDEVRGLVKNMIRRVVQRVYGGVIYTHRASFGSCNASYENPRKKGGQFGYLLNEFEKTQGCHISQIRALDREDGWMSGKTSLGNVIDGRLSYDEETRVSEAFSEEELIDIDFPERAVNEFFHERELFSVRRHIPRTGHVREIVELFENWVDAQWMARLDHPIEAKPSAVREAMKVRMVTLGNAAEYYRLEELQKVLHGTLKQVPTFQFIGHPITQETWDEQFKNKLRFLPSDYQFVSGDYSAATDNIDGSLSEFCIDEICKTIGYVYSKKGGDLVEKSTKVRLSDTPYAKLARKALVGHKLLYPDGRVVTQTNGQLMGSPMSFPILCIINAAATLVALDRFGDSPRDSDPGWYMRVNPSDWNKDPAVDFLYEGPMAVNGDDIAFACSPVEYERWKVVVTACGLTPSIGKNYFSSKFLVMNSELRWFSQTGEGDESEIEWTFSPFVNQAILLGHIDKGSGAGDDISGQCPPGEIGARQAWLLNGFKVEKPYYESLRSQFIGNHEKSFQIYQNWVGKHIPWYLPNSLGGLGLKKPQDKSWQEWDLKWAATVCCLDPEKQVRLLSIPSCKVPNWWDQKLRALEAELEKYWPQEVIALRNPEQVPYTQNGLATVSSEVEGPLKLGILLLQGVGGVEVEKEVCPAAKLLPCLKRWQKTVKNITKLVNKSSMSPMNSEKALSHKREFDLGRVSETDFSREVRHRLVDYADAAVNLVGVFHNQWLQPPGSGNGDQDNPYDQQMADYTLFMLDRADDF